MTEILSHMTDTNKLIPSVNVSYYGRLYRKRNFDIT